MTSTSVDVVQRQDVGPCVFLIKIWILSTLIGRIFTFKYLTLIKKYLNQNNCHY